MSYPAPASTPTPGQTKDVPGPNKDDKRRQAAQKQAWSSYRGDFLEPLQKSPDDPVEQPDFNVMPNLCRGIVDTGKDFLIGNEAITLEVTDGDGTDSLYDLPSANSSQAKGKPSPAQQCLNDAWGDRDDMMTLFSKMALSGGVAGQLVVKIVPPQVIKSGNYARMVLLDPSTVSVITDPDDYEKVQSYIIQYPIYNEDGATTAYKRQVIQRQKDDVSWVIANYIGATDQSMELQGAKMPWSRPDGEPYPFPPLITCQNLPNPHVWWGLSDLTTDIIGINQAIILVASCINKIAWHHGNPLIWSDAGFAGGSFRLDPNMMTTLGTLGAKIDAVQAHGDISGLMAFIDMLRSDLDQMSGIPAVALGRLKDLKLGALSGVAEELMYARIIAKTTTKRRLYGCLIRKLCQIHLYFGGFDATADKAQIAIHWPEMLPRDAFQEWQAAIFKDQLQVSGHTIFADFGLDWDHEFEMKQAEDKLKTANFNQGTGQDPLVAQFGRMPMAAVSGANQQQQAANGARPPAAGAAQGEEGDSQ